MDFIKLVSSVGSNTNWLRLTSSKHKIDWIETRLNDNGKQIIIIQKDVAKLSQIPCLSKRNISDGRF